MSNRYWQVLRTYLERPRFWILSITYLLVVWVWFWIYDWSHRSDRQGQAVISAIFACLFCSFLGLHARRQFSHPAAKTIPGYATPHLAVAAFVSSVLWLLIPLLAYIADRWPAGAVVFHACAAILMAIVACWPRGVLLMMAIPALAVWASRPVKARQYPYIIELYEGYHPNVSFVIIALALASPVIAAWFLLRLPRQGITTNDEFTLESPIVPTGSNPLADWLLEIRETEAERLTRTRWLPLVQRWRAPVAIAPPLLFMPAAFIAAAALFGWSVEEPAGWAMFALVLTCAILLLLPLGPWQSRRWAMSQEILRPVTREKYYRQFLSAMATDMVTWIAVASVMIMVVVAANWNSFAPANRLWTYLLSVSASFAVLWSMAAFVFGLGVATLHWRFWLPILAGITLAWFLGSWFSIIMGGRAILNSSRQLDQYMPYLFTSFCIANTVIGLGLALSTYRRWVRSDVV